MKICAHCKRKFTEEEYGDKEIFKWVTVCPECNKKFSGVSI